MKYIEIITLKRSSFQSPNLTFEKGWTGFTQIWLITTLIKWIELLDLKIAIQ